jgi:bifunctional ADP-heptose synthase (sugar kinase/adenylyltransferase)
VSAATWFEEDTPEALIAACRPDVLVKGGDWPVERIVGAAGVLARGGRVVSIPFEHERSTTALVQRIRDNIAP